LAYKLHKSTQKTRTKLTEAMSDVSSAGRWQPVKKPGRLEVEVEALDQAADEIRIMTGGFDAEAAGVWRSALDRLISSLESSTEYFAEFGFHVMTFKKEHPIFTGNQLREAIDEPMGVPATVLFICQQLDGKCQIFFSPAAGCPYGDILLLHSGNVQRKHMIFALYI
jgi:hypothetical protein